MYILSKYEYQKLKTIEDRLESLERTFESRIEINQFLNEIEAELLTYEGYNKETKVRLNELSETLLDRLFSGSCWAHHCIRKGRKKDLIDNMKIVILRTKESLEKNGVFLIEKKKEVEKSLEKREKLEVARALWQRVCEHEDFEDIRDSHDNRSWECLVDLIETGTITEKDLPDYGIFL